MKRKWKKTRARVAAARKNIKKAHAARIAASEARKSQFGDAQIPFNTESLRPAEEPFTVGLLRRDLQRAQDALKIHDLYHRLIERLL
jgi:hypothetical protein